MASSGEPGSGDMRPPSPAPPPHPPCIPNWRMLPGTPCHGPAPPTLPTVAPDDGTTVLGFAIFGLLGVIAVTALAAA